MNIYQSLILGLVQGLAEFLPISSSAHLILVPWLLKFPDPGLNFDVILHFGTLLAVIFYFRKEFTDIILNSEKRYLGWFIIIGTIPGGVAGYFFEKQIEEYLHAPLIIAITMILFGIFLGLADKFSKKNRSLEKINLSDVILIGLAQVLALSPGVSRSGITIIAGLLLGLNRESAAKFSFLLATPLILGASILKIRYGYQALVVSPDRLVYLAGLLITIISGFLAIKYLIKFLQKYSYSVFVWYRILVGISILIIILGK